jgi:apolipoprotein N-acyltransferase
VRARTAPSPGRGVLRAFTLGVVAGVVYFVGTIYWTGTVMRQYGDLHPLVADALMVALAAYLALFPAVFALVVYRTIARFGLGALLLVPAAWVTTELGRDHVFGGFPWILLGYSQATVLPLAQVASIFGVYGLSALVAAVNAVVVWVAFGRSRRRWWAVPVAAACLAGIALWGGARLRDAPLTREGVPIRVGIVQGNVAQDEKWDQARAATILRTYLDMSRAVAAQGARLVVWPESALPFYFQEDPVSGDLVRQLAFATRTYLLFGSDQLERGPPARYYNAAFLVDPYATIAGVYRKIHLVPFGEFVPAKRLLFFAAPLVEAVSDFSAGERMVTLPVAGHPVTTAICYEVVYPELAARAVAVGSQLLTTITNDAWFGASSAPWQHFEMASLRAVEQGRYLVRSANTGISGIVDPYGRVLARSGLFERASIVGEVRFLTGRTFYGRTGDAFAYACAAATLAALVAAMRRG